MTISKITNHEEIAISRLVTQYKGKNNIENFIRSLTDQVQEIENVIFQLREERTLNSSIGQQLDNMGGILNQLRGGLSDDEYRALLYARLAQYNSEATIEDIINISVLVGNAEETKIIETFPAGFSIEYLNANPLFTTSEINRIIEQAKPVGVEFYISYSASNYFGFDGDSDALGFDDLNNQGTGGTFSSLNGIIVLLGYTRTTESGDVRITETGDTRITQP